MILILSFVLFAVCVNAGALPELPVEKCDVEDSKCMIAGFNKYAAIYMSGVPEANIETQDVLDMDDLAFDLLGLQFTLKDGKLKGMKTSVFENVKWDKKKQHFDIVFHADVTLRGHYTAAGRILILPITGDGQMKLKLKHIELKFRFDYDIEKDDVGKEHVALKKYTYDFEVKENANFNLTNLFNGNKQLSDTMLNFLNENWVQVTKEFGRPIIDTAAKTFYKNMIQFFKSYSIEDIAKW